MDFGYTCQLGLPVAVDPMRMWKALRGEALRWEALRK
jgi:hypothetical protein